MPISGSVSTRTLPWPGWISTEMFSMVPFVVLVAIPKGFAPLPLTISMTAGPCMVTSPQTPVADAFWVPWSETPRVSRLVISPAGFCTACPSGMKYGITRHIFPIMDRIRSAARIFTVGVNLPSVIFTTSQSFSWFCGTAVRQYRAVPVPSAERSYERKCKLLYTFCY